MIVSFNINDLLFPLKQIISNYLKEDLESVELKRYVTRTNSSVDFVDLTPNDQLYILLSFLLKNKSKATRLTEDLLKTKEFCNYVYMDDMAKGGRDGYGIQYLPGSRYFGEFVGDFTEYVVPIKNIIYSQYEIDESKISGVTVRPTQPNNPVQDISNKPTVNPDLNKIKEFIGRINETIRVNQLGNPFIYSDSDLLFNLSKYSVDQIVDEIIRKFNNRYAFTPNN